MPIQQEPSRRTTQLPDRLTFFAWGILIVQFLLTFWKSFIFITLNFHALGVFSNIMFLPFSSTQSLLWPSYLDIAYVASTVVAARRRLCNTATKTLSNTWAIVPVIFEEEAWVLGRNLEALLLFFNWVMPRWARAVFCESEGGVSVTSEGDAVHTADGGDDKGPPIPVALGTLKVP